MKMSVGFPFSLCYCRDYVAIAPEIYSDGCFVDIKISSKKRILHGKGNIKFFAQKLIYTRCKERTLLRTILFHYTESQEFLFNNQNECIVDEQVKTRCGRDLVFIPFLDRVYRVTQKKTSKTASKESNVVRITFLSYQIKDSICYRR